MTLDFVFSALRGRVYLPQDELAQFGLCDGDVFSRKVSNRWREFMKKQITRARFYFNEAEEGASQLEKDSRWPVIPRTLNWDLVPFKFHFLSSFYEH